MAASSEPQMPLLIPGMAKTSMCSHLILPIFVLTVFHFLLRLFASLNKKPVKLKTESNNLIDCLILSPPIIGSFHILFRIKWVRGEKQRFFFWGGGGVGQPTHSLLAYVEERRTSSSSSYLTSTESHACFFRPPTFLFFFFLFFPPLQASLLVYCWGRTALCRWGKMPLQLLEVW